MKELEAENARLRRTVSDLTLDKMILADVNEILSKRMIAKQWTCNLASTCVSRFSTKRYSDQSSGDILPFKRPMTNLR